MRTGAREERVAETIRREVATILRSEFADPRIARATVTRVTLSRDRTVARIHVSVLGDAAQRDETLAALGRARGRVRSLLGARVRFRATPEVRFVFDPSVEFSIRLEAILAEERARSPASEEAPDEEDESS